MNSIRKHCNELQTALAELIRPELEQHKRGGPFIVLGSETGLQCCGEFHGLTSRKMAFWLRDEIPNWQNGPAWLVNDQQILSDCGGRFESAALVLNAVSCHELSHCLLVPKLCGDYEPADERGKELFPLIVCDTKPAAQYEIDNDQSLHGPEFIRMALHVRFRMIQRGGLVPFSDLMDWPRYCGHPGEWCRMSLADEFKRLECLPLSAISHIPPPDDFLKLFEDSAALAES